MPRKNRKRSTPELKDLSFLAGGGAARTIKRSREYAFRRVGAGSALKTYTCPGCVAAILPGTAHIVAWRADSIFGDADAISERRHWHTRCWEIY